jgi:hypothetical protein
VQDDNGPFELSAAAGSISFSASGDTETVLAAFATFREWVETLGVQPDPPAAEPPRASEAPVATPQPPRSREETSSASEVLALKPFLARYKLAGNRERALGMAVWAKRKHNETVLSYADFAEMWKDSAFKHPDIKLPRDVRKAATEGWLDQSSKARDATFTVTGFGETTFESFANSNQ